MVVPFPDASSKWGEEVWSGGVGEQGAGLKGTRVRPAFTADCRAF